MTDMSTNDDARLVSSHGDIGPTSPHGDVSGRITFWPDGTWTVADGLLLARARCCRDWPVLAATRIGHCGYCGQVPTVVGPW